MNNIKNKIISKQDLTNLIKKYTNENVYIFSLNYRYYIQAFIHKSFSISSDLNDCEDTYCHLLLEKHLLCNNERLEYLGDAQLYAIIAEYLYDNYPNKDEGFMTNLRIKLIKRENLAFLSRKLNFDKYILISSHLEINNARKINDSLLENVFESFIGALYKDQGFEITRKFLRNVLDTFVDFNKLIKNDDNYKSQLLIQFHSKKWSHPVYQLICKTGSFTSVEFSSCIKLKKSIINSDDPLYQKIIDNNRYTCNKIKELTDEIFSNDYYYICLGKGQTIKEAQQNSSKECISKMFNLKI